MAETGVTSFWAHSGNRGGQPETVREHLLCVAQSAEQFAKVFGAGNEARAAGLLHDLGKFGTRFQERLADPAHVTGVDHWSFGAEFAWLQYGIRNPGLPTAMECAIRGHHVGLVRLCCEPETKVEDAKRRVEEWAAHLGEPDFRNIVKRFVATGLLLPQVRQSVHGVGDPAAVSAMLDVRMLFSVLVDADFLETEAHFEGTIEAPRRRRPPGRPLDADRALAALRTHIEAVRSKSDATDEVAAIRDNLLADCIAAANGPRGLYSLTAPTGAGKTLAMLAFALEQARTHRELRRIVTVIPFLTIIEQTAKIYRQVFSTEFGRDFVIEDHSQVGSEVRGTDKSGGHSPPPPLTPNDDGTYPGGRDRRRLLAENWDAPLVVTTSVQMLESLFANRPRPCRKLHRLANSVLLFDEVQTLPPELAVVTTAAVSRLVERYGCTAVFATATQPAFGHLNAEVRKYCIAGWRPNEIVRDTAAMFAVSARRTRVEWRLEEPTSWDGLASELAEQDQVLCVVNLKRHASGLVERLEKCSGTEGLLHLSTNLCPAHRQAVLAEARRRLQSGSPCRLIATQCIEAGVDVDFPAAYRALGPLEAVAQVAGRCNRSGRTVQRPVVVFVPQRAEGEKVLYPPGYGEAAEHARNFARAFSRRHGSEAAASMIHDPQAIAECFRQFYDLSGKARTPTDLADALTARDFERVAVEYRLISSDTIRVLVPYDKVVYRRLRHEADGGLSFQEARGWFDEAAPLAVNIFRPGRDADVSGLIAVQIGSKPKPDEEADWFILADESLYDSDRHGLCGIGGNWVA